jgi:hypothetical protein
VEVNTSRSYHNINSYRLGRAHLSWEGPAHKKKWVFKGLGVRGVQILPRGREEKREWESEGVCE